MEDVDDKKQDKGKEPSPEYPMIYQKIVDVMGKIGHIGKEKKSGKPNSDYGFNYRGIDDVYNYLQPIMAKVGIFSVPEILSETREEKKTTNGKFVTYTILTVKYTFYAVDGSNVYLTVKGEAMDSGDKSCNKAMSISDKYACFMLFKIPTQEMVDPDTDQYKVKGDDDNKKPKGNKKPAGKQPPKTQETISPGDDIDGYNAMVTNKINESKAVTHLNNIYKKYVEPVREKHKELYDHLVKVAANRKEVLNNNG